MASLYTGNFIRDNGGPERAAFVAAQDLTADGNLAAGAMVRAFGAREPKQSAGGWVSARLHRSLTPADVERSLADTSAVKVERLDEVPADEAKRFLGAPAVDAVFGDGPTSKVPDLEAGMEITPADEIL